MIKQHKIGDLVKIQDDTLKGEFDYGIVTDYWKESQYFDVFYYEIHWAKDGVLKHEDYWVYENCEIV